MIRVLTGFSVAGSLLFVSPALAAPLEGQSWPKLSPEAYQTQAELRHSQLQLHQGVALASLGAMALTAGLGLYAANWAPPSQRATWQAIHIGMGGITTGLYVGAAGLALTAGDGYAASSDGTDSISIHRNLAWLHAAALANTLVLGVLSANGSLSPVLHGVLGGTTLGLMALSAGVIVLDF